MRTFVMGDPQAPFAAVMAVLDHHGLLDGDRLKGGVRLVAIGDYFDYDLDDPVGAGVEGLRVLRWLASHDEAQVVLLAGNHDLARVMELAQIDDATFARARALGRDIIKTKQREGQAAADRRERLEFLPAFPRISTYGYAARDYASFSSDQRALVVELLLVHRLHLALAGRLIDGREVLVTHAGVTVRELELLELPAARDPQRIAAALESMFVAAIDRVRADWSRGIITPLSLEPLHIAGSTGQEGGGLLYHRPADPTRRGADRDWELDPERPRRFDPRTLPQGLTQLAGHTGHRKCLAELGDTWPTAGARARTMGGIRTLRAAGDEVTYDMGLVSAAASSVAELILCDGEMRHVAPSQYDLIELA
jgi:DNA repair exonuclease SbcCD nuclease subunit